MESFGTFTRRVIKKRYIAGNQSINLTLSDLFPFRTTEFMICGSLHLWDGMALVVVAL